VSRGRGPDYRIRPAKHVERQMILDVLRRLSALGPLSEYAYVGFGAEYFVDFTLFHKGLGIAEMTSIESAASLIERCEFNKPYDSVTVLEGRSSEHFAKIDFLGPTVAWPDYTERLDKQQLGDLDMLALRLPSRSVLMATVNAEPDKCDQPSDLLKLLEERVGPNSVPHGTKSADLIGWNSSGVSREIIDAQIKKSVALRDDGAKYFQLVNFQYRDGQRMLTVGGIVLSAADTDSFGLCRFDTVDGYRPDVDHVRIVLPQLTAREMAHLDTQLPCEDDLDGPGLKESELDAYRSYYRWYPRYALVDL